MAEAPAGLQAITRGQLAGLAARLPAPDARLAVHLVEPLRVLTLRHLPGGTEAVAEAVAAVARTAGADALPGPGGAVGDGSAARPLVLWKSPSEWLLLTTDDGAADAVLHAAPWARTTLARAVDQSAGCTVFDLQGPGLTALLSRLVDADVDLSRPGCCARTRMADVAVVAIRLAAQQLWLLADRTIDGHVADWIGHAAGALADDR